MQWVMGDLGYSGLKRWLNNNSGLARCELVQRARLSLAISNKTRAGISELAYREFFIGLGCAK